MGAPHPRPQCDSSLPPECSRIHVHEEHPECVDSYVSHARLGLTCMLGLLLALPCFGADAGSFFEKARKAEKAGDDVSAFLFYMQARAREPANRRFVWAAEAVRRRAAQTLAGLGNLAAAQKLDPSDPYLSGFGARPRWRAPWPPHQATSSFEGPGGARAREQDCRLPRTGLDA